MSQSLCPVPQCPELRERDVRLEALKAVVIRLAHDFNNYLAPMLGYTSLIREEAEKESQIMKYAMMAEESVRNTESILDEILMAVRPSRRFHVQPTDLCQIVEQELRGWRDNLPATVHIALEQSLLPCEFAMDAWHWRKTIQHLLKNARYGLVFGGRLEVRLEPCALTDERRAELGLAGREIFLLQIKDNGIGMNPECLRRACEPFFSTRPKNQALGLGLSQVHSVVRLQGGQLVMESAEDQGATVSLYLPLDYTPQASPSPLSKQASKPPAAQPSVKGSKILVVDDDPMVLEVLKTTLQKAQFEVVVALDGKAGLDVYRRRSSEMGLIISDIAMPRMNGWDFAREVRAIDSTQRLIFMSGEPEATLNSDLAQWGDAPPLLIRKPCTLHELLFAVEQQMGRR